MADADYDKSIGTEERSAVAGTKVWAIVLGFVLIFGIAMLVLFFNSSDRARGGLSTNNATTRPAQP